MDHGTVRGGDGYGDGPRPRDRLGRSDSTLRAGFDEPGTVLNVDVRAGRPADKRQEFAVATMEELSDRWAIPTDHIYVVYTEHPWEDFHLT